MHTCNEIMKIQYVEIHSFNSNRLIVRRPNSQPVHTTKIFFLLYTLRNVEINHTDEIAHVFNK